MHNIIVPKELSVTDKLTLMSDDARYEVSCSADAEATALLCANDIHSKPSPPKIPKLYLSGSCIFNCAYCGCRAGRDREASYVNTPYELAKMGVEQAKQNGHGVFLSSAIHKNPDYTQEQLAEAARIMREEHNYNGFLHCKVMPEADPLLIEKTGRYANRMSVNIEVANSSGYELIAKQKSKKTILT